MINKITPEYFGLIAYDKNKLADVAAKLSPLIVTKEIGTPSMFEALEPSLGAIGYVMPSNSHNHLYNIQEIRLRSPEKPIYIFAYNISIPFLHQAMRLSVKDIFLLPCSMRDITRLQQDLSESTNIICTHQPFSADQNFIIDDTFISRPLTDVFNLIEEAYANKPSLEQAASQIYLSPSRLSHMFKDICGIGYGQYLLCRRLEASEFLLTQQNASITEIAFKLGFSSPSHFCRSFKEHLGITPTTFMRSEETTEFSPIYVRYQRLRMDLLPQRDSDDVELSKQEIG